MACVFDLCTQTVSDCWFFLPLPASGETTKRESRKYELTQILGFKLMQNIFHFGPNSSLLSPSQLAIQNESLALILYIENLHYYQHKSLLKYYLKLRLVVFQGFKLSHEILLLTIYFLFSIAPISIVLQYWRNFRHPSVLLWSYGFQKARFIL